METIAILIAICLIMTVFVLLGKGDMLIAGYNMMGEEERKEFNITRVRLLAVSFMWVSLLYVTSLIVLESSFQITLNTLLFAGAIHLLLYLSGTWCKATD